MFGQNSEKKNSFGFFMSGTTLHGIKTNINQKTPEKNVNFTVVSVTDLRRELQSLNRSLWMF